MPAEPANATRKTLESRNNFIASQQIKTLFVTSMTKRKSLSLFLPIAIAPVVQAFSTFGGVSSEVYYDQFGTLSGAFTVRGDVLHATTGESVLAIDTGNANAVSVYSSVSPSADFAAFGQNPSTGELVGASVPAFDGTPYSLGSFDLTSPHAFSATTSIGNIFDGAFNPSSAFFVTANPGFAGTKIFAVDLDTGNTTEIADVGGFSGGLDFDAAGNLYYATSSSIVSFSASEVATGSLTLADADVVISGLSGANQLALDPDGFIYVTTGFGNVIQRFSDDGTLLGNVAQGTPNEFFGNLVFEDGELLTVANDFDADSPAGQVVGFTGLETIIPEPALGVAQWTLALALIFTRLRRLQ